MSSGGSSGPLRGDLTTLPSVTLGPDDALARIHRVDRAPWWFGSAGHGRFDLPAPHGTCYLSLETTGAFTEVFDGLIVVPEAEVDGRRLSWLAVPGALRVADLTDPRCRGFGLTAAVHSSADGAVTQHVARDLHDAGFAGVRYLLRNDPAQSEVGIALFGEAGAQDHPILSTEPIGSELRDRAASVFGIETLP